MQDLHVVASALQSLQCLGTSPSSSPVSPPNHEAVVCRDADPRSLSATDPLDAMEIHDDSGPTNQLQKAPPSEVAANTHPILRFGWKPLCHVHCNGLVGQFLGGHDRELYIRYVDR